MSTMRQVRDDEPLMIAWKAYLATDDYQNTFAWASHEEHRDGSLWAAFEAGFKAASTHPKPEPVETQPGASQSPVSEERLREGLAVAKRAILKAAQDTLWCDDCPAETVIDRIDALIAEADGQLPLIHAQAPSEERAWQILRPYIRNDDYAGENVQPATAVRCMIRFATDTQP